jgi:hypothetical protein
MKETCVNCPYRKVLPATQTRYFTVGEKPGQVARLRLCDVCARAFDRDIGQWEMYAELIDITPEAPSRVLRPGRSANFGDDEAQRIQELKTRASRRTPAKGAGELRLGPRGSEWGLSTDAQHQMTGHGMSLDQVLKAAAEPTKKVLNGADSATAYHVSEDCCVLVNREQRRIIRVLDRWEWLCMSESAIAEGIGK